MKIYFKGIAIGIIAAVSAFAPSGGNAQIIVAPLFEYPSAPEDIDNLQDRSDWLMQHFWDSMNFQGKEAVDQNALNDAFRVYATSMQFATAQEAMTSVEKLISKISKNPTLTLQFCKAAEETLYGPRAPFWNDELYLKFIDNLLSQKQIKKDRKVRYDYQRQLLGATLTGSQPPVFNYLTIEGKKSKFEPTGVITIIEFGDPDCTDCRHARLKMETDVSLSGNIDTGKVNVMFINVDPEEGWQEKLASYPAKWHVGASEDVSDHYDLRATPSIYVIDRNGKIAAKNIDIETAVRLANTLVQAPQ